MELDDVQFLQQAHEDAVKWAKELLAWDPSTWVILDTETTGLGSIDEVVQIAVIDGAGNPLMDNVLVKPTVRITEGARSVHGITEEMVANAPRFSKVFPALYDAVKGKTLVIYNANYDLSILDQSGKALDYLVGFEFSECMDAMQRYAEWYGEWSDWHGSFRWQRLPNGDHSALGDCRAVLQLIRKMAEG